MTCEMFAKVLDQYGDGSLPKEVSRQAQDHITECKSCFQLVVEKAEAEAFGEDVLAVKAPILPSELVYKWFSDHMDKNIAE